MSIHVDWYNAEKDILLWEFTGQWTVDEFRQAVQTTTWLSTRVAHGFDLIFDASRSKPPRFPMSEFQRALKLPVSRRDRLVVVTTDMFIISLLSILQRLDLPNLHGDRIVIVDTMDAALETIAAGRVRAGDLLAQP